jgi:predicted transcriptional regulator
MQMWGFGAKKKILRAVEQLPDDATIEDAIERLYFLAKIEKGIREADAGLTVSHDEAKKRLGGE